VFPPPPPSAVAPVGGAPATAAEAVEEKTEFDVVIKDAGPKKIEVIKVIRQLVNLSLTEAKALAETADGKSWLQSARMPPWTPEEAGRSRRCHRSQIH